MKQTKNEKNKRTKSQTITEGVDGAVRELREQTGSGASRQGVGQAGSESSRKAKVKQI
jgi:hypothetical protein